MKYLVTILFFTCLNVNSQQRVSLTVAYQRADIFQGIEYGRRFNRLEAIAGFEYGINRSLFQQRFFPKIKLGTAYYAISKDRFSLGPIVQYGYATLVYNKEAKLRAHFHELGAGVRWQYGQRWRVGQTLLVGGIWEQKHSTITLANRTDATIGYTFQIDLSYAF